MKLHLPVKLRASLIAAVIAVAAGAYNAAYADTTVPNTGYTTNDISLTDIASGHYTAGAVREAQIYAEHWHYVSPDPDNNITGGWVSDGFRWHDLSWSEGSGYTYDNGRVSNTSAGDPPTNINFFTDAAGTMSNGENAGSWKLSTGFYTNSDANAVITIGDGTGTSLVSSDVTLTAKGDKDQVADGKIVISNSVASAQDYTGGLRMEADDLTVSGSSVVLEDATITIGHETTLAAGTKLVIVDGATDSLTEEEQDALGITGVASGATTDWTAANSVHLGAVSGTDTSSLVVVGSRPDATPAEGTPAWQAGQADGKLSLNMDGISGVGQVSFANAVLSSNKALTGIGTLTLVNSKATVEGSTDANNISVNGESYVEVHGDLTSLHSVAIDGKVVSTGNVLLSDATDDGGVIGEGAWVESQGSMALTGVDVNKASALLSGSQLSIQDSTLSGSEKITFKQAALGETYGLWLRDQIVTDASALSGTGKVVIDGSQVDKKSTISTNSRVADEQSQTKLAGDIAITGSVLSGGSVVTTKEGNVTINKSTGSTAGTDVPTVLVAAEVSTGNGAMTVQDSVVKGAWLDEDGNVVSADTEGATYTKSTLSATKDSIISNSTVTGATIDVTAGDLTITNASSVTGDVDITVKDEVRIEGKAELALNGTSTLNPDVAHNASLTATKFWLNDAKDGKVSITDGAVNITDTTYFKANHELTLDNVYNVDKDGGKVAAQLGKVHAYAGGGGKTGTVLTIKGGSLVDINDIRTESNDSMQTDPANYFGTLNVGSDSVVTVTSTSRNGQTIDNLNVGLPTNLGGVAGDDSTGSKVEFKGAAFIKDAKIDGTGQYALNDDGALLGTVVTVDKDAHIGTLTLTGGGVLNLDNTRTTDATAGVNQSCIADIAANANGSINVVRETLTTPELSSTTLSLGLNSGIVELASVAAVGTAIDASVTPVNAHVSLSSITNATIGNAGAKDKTPVNGLSTIKTSLTNVVDTVPVNYKGAREVVNGKRYYFVATKGITLADAVKVLDAQGNVTLKTELQAGDVVVKDTVDYVATSQVVLKGVDGADDVVYTKYATDDSVWNLTADEKTYLTRDFEAAELDNQLVYVDNTLTVGQKCSDITLELYYPSAVYQEGTIQAKTDGIASLTLVNGMDSDLTTIIAYETLTTEKDSLSGLYKADPNSGTITIGGNVTGQDNTLTADKKVSIGGIVTNETDGGAYENSNSVTSHRGDVAIGTNGIVGSKNTLLAEAGNVLVQGATVGNDNKLTAHTAPEWAQVESSGNVTTAAITGDRNILKADINVTTADITGNNNELTALTGNVATNSIAGDVNLLTAAGNVTVTGTLKGDDNVLKAQNGNLKVTQGILADGAADDTPSSSDSNKLYATNGDIVIGTEQMGGQALVGSKNTLLATNGSIKVFAELVGNENELVADEYIRTATITGDENQLTSHRSYINVEGALKGDENVLTAATTLTVRDGILKDTDADTEDTQANSFHNRLTAVSTVTIGATGDNSVEGDYNVITSTGANVSLGGNIAGDDNTVIAATGIGSQGGVIGVDNLLQASTGVIELGGSVIGAGNDLQAHQGSITVGGDVIGTDIANRNTLTAAQPIDINGTLAGFGNTVTTYSQAEGATGVVPIAQGETAIHIGTFAAQGTDLVIAEDYSPVYGEAKKSGAIVIDRMTAAKSLAADGTLETATLDSTLLNTITSLESSVTIGSMENSNAYTNISAAKNVIIGSQTDLTDPDEGSNLTITAGGDLVIYGNSTDTNADMTQRVNALTLTDSRLTIAGSITGSSLTLDTTDATGKTWYKSTVGGDVLLDALTLKSGAILGVEGEVVVGDLTLVGANALLNCSTVTVLGSLTVKDGANYSGNLVRTTSLVIDGDSTYQSQTLEDLENLTVTGKSQVTVQGGLTLEDSDTTAEPGGTLKVLDNSSLEIQGALNVSTITLEGSTLKATGGMTTTGDISAKQDTAGNVSHIQGDIAAADDVTLIGTTTKQATADNITMSGTLDVQYATAGTIAGADIVTAVSATLGDISITRKQGDKATKDSGDVTLTDTETGAISGANDVSLTDTTVKGDIGMDGKLTMVGGSAGDVSSATSAELSGAAVVGTLTLDATAKDGKNDVTALGDSTIGAIVSANDVTLKGGSDVLGDVAMDGVLVLEGGTIGSVTGTITGATITDGIINSGLTVNDGKDKTQSITTITNSTIGGALSAEELITHNDVTVTGGVTADKLSVNNGTLTADSVTVTGATTLANGFIDAGSFTTGTLITTNMSGTVSDLTVTGNFTMNSGDSLTVEGPAEITGMTTLNGAELNGTVLDSKGLTVNGGAATMTGPTDEMKSEYNYDIKLNNGGLTVTNKGNVSAPTISGVGALTVETDGQVAADLSGVTSADIKNGTVVGDIAMTTGGTGVVNVTNGTAGNITDAGNVSLTAAKVGDVTMSGTLTAEGNDTTIGAVSGAKATQITGNVTGKSLSTKDLTVATAESSFTTTDDIAADGTLDIKGATTSTKGNISLTSDDKASAITADVKATVGNVTLDGPMAVTGADITAGKTLTVKKDSTITTADSVLTGGTGIVMDGTLNAGEGTVVDGTLTSVQKAAVINKTGGDTLALAGDTDFAGTVNVDASTLQVGSGAKFGTVNLDASTLEVDAAPGATTGKMTADTVTATADSVVKADIDLAAGTVDTIVADQHSYNNAALALDTVEPYAESGIADQTRITVATGGTITSSVHEDIVHDMDTLNAHAENMGDHIDIVLSKNYKGATKTENQTQVANGLASVNAEEVQGSRLGDVLDALAHTRSEGDSTRALDSLGGRGIAGLQKLVADETHEHMQTLRSTLDSAAAGVRRRYDQNGKIDGVNSSAFTGSVTGGTTEVDGNANAGDYSRNSLGFMLAGVHAVSKEWTFGGDLAYSYMDGECGETSFSGDVFYFDIAMMQKHGRFSQVGTLGAGLFRFDTDRTVTVNAKGHDFAGTATGSTNASAVNISYEANYDLIVKDQHTFSTIAMTEAVFAHIDGMHEENLGNAGLYSEFDDVASLTVGFGGRYTYSFGEENNPGYVMAEAMVVFEAGDDTAKVTNQFIAGGQSFQVMGPEAGDVGLRLNAGALVPFSKVWGVFGNVTAEFREEQASVGGAIGIKRAF